MYENIHVCVCLCVCVCVFCRYDDLMLGMLLGAFRMAILMLWEFLEMGLVGILVWILVWVLGFVCFEIFFLVVQYCGKGGFFFALVINLLIRFVNKELLNLLPRVV